MTSTSFNALAQQTGLPIPRQHMLAPSHVPEESWHLPSLCWWDPLLLLLQRWLPAQEAPAVGP